MNENEFEEIQKKVLKLLEKLVFEDEKLCRESTPYNYKNNILYAVEDHINKSTKIYEEIRQTLIKKEVEK